MYLHRSIIDPEPDDKPRRHRSRPFTALNTFDSPSPVLGLNSHSTSTFMRLSRRSQGDSIAPWQIALIVMGCLLFLAVVYALYILFRARKSKETGEYPLGIKIFSFSSPRRAAGRTTSASASRRRMDGRSKRRRGSAHLSSADDGGVGTAIGERDEDDKEMDPSPKLSRLLKNMPVQPAHRSPIGTSPSTVSMMHYHYDHEEEMSPPPPPTGSTVRPSTGFTSTSSITRTSFPSPHGKENVLSHELVELKGYASTKESAVEQTSPTISSPVYTLNGDPLSASVKGFSLGNTLTAALDKHRHRRGSKSSSTTAPNPSSPPNSSLLNSGLGVSPPRPTSAVSSRPRSQTQSQPSTKSPRSRSHTNRSQTRTLDDGQPYGSHPTSAGGPGTSASSPLSPSSLGASLGLFGRHNTSTSNHSHSHHSHQQGKSNHSAAQPPPKSTLEDGWRDQTHDRDLGHDREADFDDGDSIAHTIRASFDDENRYMYGVEQERDVELDEQLSTSFTTQSGTTGSGTSNAHTNFGDITPRAGGSAHSNTRIASPRTNTARLGSSHSTASHSHPSFTPPTTAMSRTTFSENGVAVPFSGIGLAFGRAGRDTLDSDAKHKKDKENSRRRGRDRTEEYG